jgi:hypothetical protein
MIATEILKGQGLGNQLFCYITTRCIALDRNLSFGIKDTGWIGDKRYNQNGIYWMNLDMGKSVPENLPVYNEIDIRYKTNTCHHDIVNGCDIRSYDIGLSNVFDNTLIFGIMQDEKYFYHRKSEIKQWLRIKPEYDCFDFSDKDICILNFRGGEYVGYNELYLEREYWINAMENMKKYNPNLEFVVITDDVKSANLMLPELKSYHFDVGKDYAIIKNAHYLILSNSSFGFFPSFTNDNLKVAISPKYWARHNVSDGYWSTEQNLYSDYLWQDRKGNLFTKDECINELIQYKNDQST